MGISKNNTQNIHQINTGKSFVIIFPFTQQYLFSTLHTNTFSVANYKAKPITYKTDFFAYIFCGKTNKKTLSNFSAHKIVNTLSSSVASCEVGGEGGGEERGKKDIQQNPKTC